MNSGRLAFVALLLAASALHWGVALPARRATALAEAELGRVKTETESLRQRRAERERRRAAEEAWRQAGRTGGESPVTVLRRSLLDSIDGAPVSGVRLDVGPAPAPLAAHARLSADGSFDDLVRLSQRVVGLRTGLVPERLRWKVSGSQLSLDVEGATLRDRP